MTRLKSGSRPVDRAAQAPEEPYWHLCLYVAGRSPRSRAAVYNLERICRENLSGHYKVEVIDILENAGVANEEQILAVPFLVRRAPSPICRVVGDLSDSNRVLARMNFRAPKGRQT